jgi:hypothetical protein
MSEVTCQSCANNSRTFDPFMLLSVPLPKHSEKQISVYLIRKMPHLLVTLRHYAESDYDSSAFLSCLSAPVVLDSISIPSSRSSMLLEETHAKVLLSHGSTGDVVTDLELPITSEKVSTEPPHRHTTRCHRPRGPVVSRFCPLPLPLLLCRSIHTPLLPPSDT